MKERSCRDVVSKEDVTIEFVSGEQLDDVTLGLEDILYLRNFENREIWLSDEITSASAETFLTEVREINRRDFGLPIEKRTPIRVFIDSPGGDAIAGLSIVDTINASKTPIHTINVSRACSMAFQIFISGQKRFAFKHSCFLIHDGTEGGYDSSNKFRDRMSFYDDIDKANRAIILDRTKIDEETFEKYSRHEWYILVPKAVELGIVDTVVENFDEVCNFSLKKKTSNTRKPAK